MEVQRKVVVRTKSGRFTENKSRAADVVDHGGIIWSVPPCAQPAHMDVNEIGRRHELIVPDLFEQHGAREQLVASLHHVLEQAEFPRQQLDRAVAALGRPFDEVEFKWSHAQHCFPGLAGRRNSASILATSSTIANGLVR